mmetsp:Transcript_113737/g.361444  ORF Transcript_113737/g.361444 Transcript_113737/m.361444 type:complete len:328 (-) Transcript_113737:141-1124(-)
MLNVAGAAAAMTYAPPTAPQRLPGNRIGYVNTAAALDLLRGDPASLTSFSPPPGGRPRGQKSAAKVALERYEEALQRQTEGPADLLEFDESSSPPPFSVRDIPEAAAPVGGPLDDLLGSPAASAASGDLLGGSPSERCNGDLLLGGIQAVPAPALPALASVAFAAQAVPGGFVHSGGASGTGLWPGETVLARYVANGSWYRARIVRVYSSRGASLADIEWLRPQASSPVTLQTHSEFLCNAPGEPPPDETLHRHGLQVETDIRRPGSSDHAPLAQRLGAAAARTGAPEASPAASATSFASAVAVASDSSGGGGGSASGAPIADLLDF